jgi:glycosyltransferase involved in cell wall biosynthesis
MAKLVHVATVARTLGFLNGQIGYLRERGFDIEAIASDDGTLRSIGDENSIAIHPVPMTRKIDPFHDAVALVRIWRVLRTVRPDIVHTHTPKGGLLGNLAAAAAGVPVRLHHVHGLPHLACGGVRRVLLKWSERVASFFASETVCVSKSVMEAAIADNISPRGKVKVLLHGSINGIDAAGEFNPARYTQQRRTVRERFGIPPDAIVVGCVARLVADKGIPELAEAWAGIHPRTPRAHLLLVGTHADERPLPAKTAAMLKTQPRVHFAGFVTGMAPLYAAMDIAVLPSHREGLPVVLLEAAAMGLPVVTTRVPGCIDAIEPDRTALVVPVRSPAALSEAILRYIQDPQLRRAHGEAGRERVLGLFEQKALWTVVRDEYRQLLGRAGASA